MRRGAKSVTKEAAMKALKTLTNVLPRSEMFNITSSIATLERFVRQQKERQ